MKTISLKLPAGVAAKLEYEVHRRGVSKSLVVREALAEYLVEKPKSKKTASFFDLAQDFCGCVSLDVNLSHDKKHMKDYGK